MRMMCNMYGAIVSQHSLFLSMPMAQERLQTVKFIHSPTRRDLNFHKSYLNVGPIWAPSEGDLYLYSLPFTLLYSYSYLLLYSLSHSLSYLYLYTLRHTLRHSLLHSLSYLLPYSLSYSLSHLLLYSLLQLMTKRDKRVYQTVIMPTRIWWGCRATCERLKWRSILLFSQCQWPRISLQTIKIFIAQ